jgi:CRISPR-associated protein Csm1
MLVKKADRFSAAERRDEFKRGYKSELRRLRHIFTRHDFFYEVGPLDLRGYKLLEGIKADQSSTDEYRKSWYKFVEDVELLRELYSNGINDELSLRHYIKTFLELLRRYTFFIPSAPSREVEVRNSLYAHHKTSAALASSMIINRENHKGDEFTMILGDIAGVQKYVYGNRMYKGALKMLRSRSIYLSILTEAVARHIVNKLGLLPLNLIYCSGGRFMILAHYIRKVELERILREVEEFLLKEQRGLIGLKLSYTYIGKRDFEIRKKFREKFRKKLEESIKRLRESSLEMFKRTMYTDF